VRQSKHQKIAKAHSSQSSSGELTLGTEFFCPLIDEWLFPTPDRVDDTHVIFCLGGEARDCLALYDRLAVRIDDSSENRTSVATALKGISFVY
jgi:hypothetical protein